MLTLRAAERTAKILRNNDIGSHERPGLGYLDVGLFEDNLTLFVEDGGGARLPLHFVERVSAGAGKVTLHLEACPAGSCQSLLSFLRCRFCHRPVLPFR